MPIHQQHFTTLLNGIQLNERKWQPIPFFSSTHTHIHLVNMFSIVFHWKHSLNNELLKLCAQNLQGNKTWICWTNVAQVRTTTTHQHFNGFRFYVTEMNEGDIRIESLIAFIERKTIIHFYKCLLEQCLQRMNTMPWKEVPSSFVRAIRIVLNAWVFLLYLSKFI